MDPFTIWMCGMATLWLIRRGTEDCIAIFTGREPPRVLRLRERRAVGRVSFWEELGDLAVALVRRRRVQRPMGPFRRYLAELWVDAWDDALAAHARRRRRRSAAADPGPAPAPDVDDTEVIDADWFPIDDDPDDEADPPDAGPPPPPPTAPPNPAGTTIRKALPMSTTQVTVDGDVISPLTALAFATGSLDLNDAIAAQLEVMQLNLRGAKLSPGVLAQVGAVIAAADQFRSAVLGSRGEYAKHVAAQAEIAGDPALRDTVYRTYLDTANL